MKHEYEARSGLNACRAVEYLEARGVSQQMQADLGIQYLSYSEAISPRWGFGKQATSPDGVIAFPVSEGVAIARNFYTSPKRQAQHLADINRQWSQQRLEPIKKVPKYVVPQGDRGKGILYDPYERLHPGTDQPVLFVTEDIFGVIKAAARGVRVLSAVGVWLVTKDELKSDDLPMFWGRVQVFMADADALENALVCRAMIRSGVVLRCKIGNFPSQSKDVKVGLDEWLDSHPHATKSELQSLVEEQTRDALDWVEGVYPNLHVWLRDRGYTTTESTQIAAVVRDGIQRELLQHFGVETLRSTGIYQDVLKPLGVTLSSLKGKAKSEQSAREDEKAKVANLLVEIGREADLFHDAEQDAYADIEVDGSRQTYKLGSRGFKRWLYRNLYERQGISASREAYSSAVNTLESIALFDGSERKVWIRTAKHEGKLYLDLANDKWQVIEIDTQGWRIIDRPPVRFIRPGTLGELPVPTRNGSLDNLRELINIEDREWILLVTFLLFAYTQGPTFPVLMLMAARGSGKTAITEFLKSLIDPGKAGLTNLPPDTHRLAVSSTHRWMMAYDNVSRISSEQSDMICRVATGFGFSTRTLFTTGEETVFEVARPQIITAIDPIVTRDDLADRVLLVQLPEITRENRLTKEELDTKLEKLRPGIVGALLTTLSQTMKALPDTHPDELPRMADYGRFAIAAEGALGLKSGDFWEAFNHSRENARAVVLEASPLAEAITALVRDRKTWSGTAQQLLKVLEAYADNSITRSKFWPKSPNNLTRQINRLAPDLSAIGIEVSSSRSNTSRIISFFKKNLHGYEKTSSPSSPTENQTLEPLHSKKYSGDDNGDDKGDDGDDKGDDGDDKVTMMTIGIVTPETLTQQGTQPKGDDDDDVSPSRGSFLQKIFAVGDIVIALKDFPGQQVWIPKGAWGEIIMPECNGLIRVEFDQGVKDVPVQDVELAS